MKNSTKLFILFAPVLIMACAINTNVIQPAVYRNPAKLARDIVITPAPAMERLQIEKQP